MKFKIQWGRIWKIIKWPFYVLIGVLSAYMMFLLAAVYIYGNNLTGEE